MRRILFVDDEQNVLDGLRRMLRSMRNDWMMEFASGGPQALAVLETSPFDVVVTDMRMAAMDGAELLARVRDRHPRVVRIVLSGQADPEALMRSVSVAHQFLSKPCDTELLKATVARACALHDLLANESLQKTVSRLEVIPSLPSLYRAIVHELESENPSPQRIGDIISRDPGMTSKILQMVNSSFFGVRRHVSSPAQATVLIGTEAIKALTLSTQIFTQFDKPTLRQLSIDAICAHSNRTGLLARSIAQAQHADQKVVDYALMGGLLHDTGKLVLATQFSDDYRKAMALAAKENIPLVDAERLAFGSTHAEVGAYLLGLWGLPDPVVEAVAWHHRPNECPGDTFCALAAVHAANVLTHEQAPNSLTGTAAQLDTEYLQRLGLMHRLPAWRDISNTLSLEENS